MVREVFNAPAGPRPRMHAPRPAASCIEIWATAARRRPAGCRALSQMMVALRTLVPLHGAAATNNGYQALVWH